MTKKLRGGGLGARAGVTPTRSVHAISLGAQMPHLSHRPGRWIAPTYAAVPDGTTPATAHVLRAAPFYVPLTRIYDRIGVRVTTSGDKARLGIYADDGNGLPVALVLDAGELDVSTITAKEIAIDGVLPGPAWYWLVVVNNQSTSYMSFATAALGLGRGTQDATLASGMVSRSLTYGALPDPFGEATGFVATTIAIRLRVADPQPT